MHLPTVFAASQVFADLLLGVSFLQEFGNFCGLFLSLLEFVTGHGFLLRATLEVTGAGAQREGTKKVVLPLSFEAEQ